MPAGRDVKNIFRLSDSNSGSPFNEQRKIAAILGTWDEAIALTQRRIAAGQRRKLGLMQRLLTGQVRFGVCGTARRKPPSDWRMIMGQFLRKLHPMASGIAAIGARTLQPKNRPGPIQEVTSGANR
jgi:hypothetical protein